MTGRSGRDRRVDLAVRQIVLGVEQRSLGFVQLRLGKRVEPLGLVHRALRNRAALAQRLLAVEIVLGVLELGLDLVKLRLRAQNLRPVSRIFEFEQ